MSNCLSNTMIAQDEIKVWYASTPSMHRPALLKKFISWLSPVELETYKKFRFAKDQHTYLIAHALLRGALSRCCNITPSAWQFCTNAYNKPFVSEPSHARDLHFNLSHTDGMVALAMTKIGPVGIDVESLSRNEIEKEVAADVLSEEEYLDFSKQKYQDQHVRLLQYWTLKEAFVKATGLGITVGLKHFSFDLAAQPHPSIRFLTVQDFSTHDWQFWQCKPAAGHLLAVACQPPSTRKALLSLQEALWLQEM